MQNVQGQLAAILSRLPAAPGGSGAAGSPPRVRFDEGQNQEREVPAPASRAAAAAQLGIDEDQLTDEAFAAYTAGRAGDPDVDTDGAHSSAADVGDGTGAASRRTAPTLSEQDI